VLEIIAILGHKGDNRKAASSKPGKDNWTDDVDDYDLVRYAVGIPLGYDENQFKEFLLKDGYPDNIKLKWKEFEGLEYLKIIFKNNNDSQRFLKQPLILQDTPIIVLPKLPNKTLLEMLSYHQLRVQSLNGPVEGKIPYAFLSKFGLITDFIILDSLDHPTTFFVTFTNNTSKKELARCYPNCQATVYENNKEYVLHFELNVKPALVLRKKPFQSFLSQQRESELSNQNYSNKTAIEEIFTNPEVTSPNINPYNTQQQSIGNSSLSKLL